MILKASGGGAKTITETDGDNFQVDASGLPQGRYFFQQFRGGDIVFAGEFEIEQNLATAPSGWDPRPYEEQVIDAIDAMLAGRATQQQREISVGDKKISYSTFDELKQWRQFFVKKLAKRKGKKIPNRQVAVFESR